MSTKPQPEQADSYVDRLLHKVRDGKPAPPASASTESVGPKCPLGKCDGSTWFVVRTDEYGRPAYGRCDCLPIIIKHKAFDEFMASMQWCEIPGDYAKGDFESFESERQPVAFERVKRWAEYPSGWIFMTGDVGIGKTHLAVAAIRTALTDTTTAALFSVPSLLARLRPGGKGDPVGIMESLKSVDVLGLDDLGAQRNTEWVTEQMFVLLDWRAMRRLPTIITSNDDVDQLEKSDGWRRIGDRITEHAVMIKMKPGSYRRIIAERNIQTEKGNTR